MVEIDDAIMHIGTATSGRYPKGSGKDPQRSKDVITLRKDAISKGVGEGDVWKYLGYSSNNQYKKAISIAGSERKAHEIKKVINLHDDGMSNSEIANRIGKTEGSVRYMLKNKDLIKKKQIDGTSEELKSILKDKPYLDVGKGVEVQLGITSTKLGTAIQKLKDEGYEVHTLHVKQASGNKDAYTELKVLTKEKDINVVKKHKTEIESPGAKTEDGGLTYTKFYKPKQVSWDEVGIRYAENGGEDRDGLIQVRRGVDGLDLGTSHYAQVRINVGGTHYLKGMAVYSDDMPKGKNLVFNTNKSKSKDKTEVLKELKDKNSSDPSRMFGTYISGQKGKFQIVNEEGSWAGWNGTRFSAQFLSKQPISLIRERVTDTLNHKRADLDTIMKLDNPVVKKKMLDDYAMQADSAQRELKVRGLPRTQAHVLLPYPGMNPKEVYAPNYSNGDKLVLIRYPHAGTFEIPELTVNNKYAPAKKGIGNAIDAIGIHPSVAHKLSGADFDGDAVYAIKNNARKVQSTASLKGLKNFDPNMYSYPKGVAHKKIDPDDKQHKMGNVSNLIADMTVRNAPLSEITRAVKHSMVIIDSEKHDLNWKQSEIDNGIAALRKQYQSRPTLKYDPETGAITKGSNHLGGSTLITRASSDITVADKRFYKTKSDGSLVKRDIPLEKETYVKKGKNGKPVLNKKGEPVIITKHNPITRKAINLVDDASMLSYGTSKEKEYVTYINTLKSYSNKAQKASMATKLPKKNGAAAKLYSQEVKSITDKYNTALLNAPRERKAQVLANDEIMRAMRNDKNMTKDQLKKVKRNALATARVKTGAQRFEVDITPKEWEAIQANAFAPTYIAKVFTKADNDKVARYATPKPRTTLASGKISRARTLIGNGYTYADVARIMGVSPSTLRAAITNG